MICMSDFMCFPSFYREKCFEYWPTERSARYQYFVVDPLNEYNMPQYIVREFKVTDARVSLFKEYDMPQYIVREFKVTDVRTNMS